ncbi:2-keto-3-deoxy-L-rhamnonate aldolase [Escherichia coli]|nr:2-keto-3-deoxy-L-rhamnonate aldolase [Escherichia coli]
MSTALLDAVVKKNRARLIPFMLALYVLAFLDRSNIGFAKQTYQIDTGLSNEAYALGAGIFFVVYAFLGVPANLLMRKMGARTWIGTTTLLWGFLSAAMAWADTEAKFLIVRTLLGAAEAGFFPGMIYLTSQWFPQRNRASIMGLFYMGAPLALTLGSPLSGALLEMHGFMGHPGWFWMFVIEGLLAVGAGVFTFFWLDDTPEQARFLSKQEKTLLINQLASEEQQKVTSRLSDALRNGRVWQLAIIYLTIQVAVYGLIFFLPTQVAALLGTKVGFTASVVTAIPWVAALFGTWLIPRYSDKTGERRNVAALTLLAAGIGIGLSGLLSPVLAIVALCVAAIGFIAVQPVFWTMPTQLLSGTALAAGIGFVNLFGAVGGFIAPILRVKAETLFASDAAGLLTLAAVAVIGMNALLTNPFKERLRKGEVQIGLWLSSTTSYMAEIAATSGYDWLLIDGEHAPNTIQDLYHQLQAVAPYASQPVIRPVEGSKSLIKQVLDIGAQTLLIPMVDTADQARQVVSATRYPPYGERGVGASVARAARWGRIENYMAQVNDSLCLLVQVESKTALDNLDEILDVEGIDGVFIGPADLSASLGYPDNAGHPEVQRIIETSIRRIRAAGKAAGFLAVAPDMAQQCLAWGANFVAVGVDTMLYSDALDQRLAMFKSGKNGPRIKGSY